MSIKKSICFLIVLTVITCAQAFTAGNGTPENPYQISTRADLEAVNNDLAANYILINDIDLSGTTYTQAVIAPGTSTYHDFQGTKFTGSFNGDGFKIQNLTINGGSNDYIALFGSIGSGGSIQNLGIVDCNISGNDYVGSLCGFNHSTITSSYATGVVSGNDTVGGLCGRNTYGTITSSYATGAVSSTITSQITGGLCGSNSGTITSSYATSEVSGSYSVGGLCGSNSRGVITSSCATGEVSGGSYVGGLCGSNSGTITSSYATGEVSGSDDVGGLCGKNLLIISSSYSTGAVSGSDNVGGLCGYNGWSTITSSYATGAVSGGSDAGGLCGYNDSGTIISSYAIGVVSSNSRVGGLCGKDKNGIIISSFWDIQTSGKAKGASGVGKTTIQMKIQSTFIDAGWDFAGEETNGIHEFWYMGASGYPELYVFSESYQKHIFEGLGTSQSPYRIYDKYDLVAVNQNIAADYILMNDIDLSDIVFDSVPVIYTFTGTFDGNGLAIKNLTISGISNYIGLFGWINSGGTVTDLGIINCDISGKRYVGGLCGGNGNGIITSSYATGVVSGNGGYIGGLCGCSDYGLITSSYATGVVTGSYYVGGLCGYNKRGEITSTYATGAVSGTINSLSIGGLCGKNYYGIITTSYATGTVSGNINNDNVGGLCGENYYGAITTSYATGTVSGSYYVGGLCGYSDRGEITSTYATGAVSGSSAVGGLCGVNNSKITSCYTTGAVSGGHSVGGLCGDTWSKGSIEGGFWDIETSGKALSDGGEGKTTAEMKTLSTFTGWDFDDDWAFYVDSTGDGEYPLLKWQPRKSLVLPGNLNFGKVDVDASKYLNFTITNNGTLDINVSSITCPNGFTGEFNGNIAAGTSQNITIKFNPTELKNYSGNITVNSDTVYGVKEITTEGIGSGSRIYIGNYSLNFYDVRLGKSKSLDFTIFNNGNIDLNVSSINYPDGFSGDWSGTITPDSSQQITAIFTPTELKKYGYIPYFGGSGSVTTVIGGSDYYTIIGSSSDDDSKGTKDSATNITVTSDAVSGDNSLYCKGKGIGGVIEVSGDTHIGFIRADQQYSSEFIITNTGNIDLIVSGIVYPDCIYGDWSGIIPAGESQVIPVVIDPNAVGDFSGKVTVQCDMVAGSNSIYYEVYATNYYQIFTPSDLEAVNNDLYGIYDLMNDIDLSDIVYTNAVIETDVYRKELGEKGKKHYGFEGVFNGNGRIISNLTIESIDPNNMDIGLFASIDGEYAKVTRLGLENVSITSNIGMVGSLCGSNDGNIMNCYSTGSVRKTNDTGSIGGLCGYNRAIITNSYSACLVIDDTSKGDRAIIGNRHGGFCGYDSGQITNCFWDIETSDQTGSYGGKGNTTAQMKDMNTFLDAGWNFSGYSADWFMPEDNYPVFGGFAGQPLRIDIVSMAMLADCWLQTDLVLDDPNNLCYQIDLNGDSTINDDDLLAITNNWLGYHFWENMVDFDDSDFNDDDSWTYGGMDEWLIVDGEGANGSICFKSDDVSYGQDADLDWVVDTTGFNTIGFNFKFDAWSNCVLTFYINGVEAYSHSGAVDWTYVELPIPAAEHTLTWTFTRGFAFSYGENAAYLDNVILFNK